MVNHFCLFSKLSQRVSNFFIGSPVKTNEVQNIKNIPNPYSRHQLWFNLTRAYYDHKLHHPQNILLVFYIAPLPKPIHNRNSRLRPRGRGPPGNSPIKRLSYNIPKQQERTVTFDPTFNPLIAVPHEEGTCTRPERSSAPLRGIRWNEDVGQRCTLTYYISLVRLGP